MNLHKRKIFNFRYYFLLSLAAIAMIFLAAYVLKPLSYKIIFVSVVAAVGLILTVLLILLKRGKLALFVSIILLAALPVANLCVRQSALIGGNDFEDEKVLISGRICDNFKINENGTMIILIDDVTVTDGEKSRSFDGKFKIFSSAGNLDVYNYKVGCYLDAFAKPKFLDLETDNLSTLSGDIFGTAYCNYYELSLKGETKLSLRDKIKTFVFEKLKASGAKHYEIGYAMLFGDTSYVDDNELEIMRSAGIAHLLAVSGLHISLIVMAISFILKKLRVPKLANLIVVAVLLAAYGYVCNFSVSVVRASIMSLLSLYAVYRGKPYDNLSALGFAAFVILLINPLKLFSLSFILSFGAVLSIILTSALLSKFLSRFFYKKFAGTVAATIGVQFGIIFTDLCYFGKYPILSVLTNLVTIPVQSFAFLLLFVSLPFYLIFPEVPHIILFFGNITDVVLRFNGLLAGLNLNLVADSINTIIIPLSLVLLFSLSDKTMCRARWKVALLVISVAVTAIFQSVF